jgi:hypothetical protein
MAEAVAPADWRGTIVAAGTLLTVTIVALLSVSSTKVVDFTRCAARREPASTGGLRHDRRVVVPAFRRS